MLTTTVCNLTYSHADTSSGLFQMLEACVSDFDCICALSKKPGFIKVVDLDNCCNDISITDIY